MDGTGNIPVDLGLMDEVLAQCRGQPGTLIPALQQAQAIYGYLPREAMEYVAEQLGLSLGQVYGVATFYTQFFLKRRGRHVLRLCDGTACHVKGASSLLTTVAEDFHIAPGETTADGQLTVELVYCLGSCALAPVAVLDGQVMGRMRQEGLTRRLQRQIAGDG